MSFSLPQSRGVNSTFSPAGRVPNTSDTLNGPRSVGWNRKGNKDAPSATQPGVGQGMGGGGSTAQRPTTDDARSTMLSTLTLPRPATGGVMGPGRSYPRTGMGGGLDRLGGAPRSAMTL